MERPMCFNRNIGLQLAQLVRNLTVLATILWRQGLDAGICFGFAGKRSIVIWKPYMKDGSSTSSLNSSTREGQIDQQGEENDDIFKV